MYYESPACPILRSPYAERITATIRLTGSVAEMKLATKRLMHGTAPIVSCTACVAVAILVAMADATPGRTEQPAELQTPGDTRAARPAPRIMGVGMDGIRATHHDAFIRIGIMREASKHFASGGVEWRVWLANGVFARIAYGSDGDAAVASAIILAAPEGDVANQLEQETRARFGTPSWHEPSGTAAFYRLVWGGHGAPENGVTPDPQAGIVAELSRQPQTGLSVTLALPSWFASKR
jgi:hypothetical protein